MERQANTADGAGEADALSTDRLRLWLQMLKAVRSVEACLRERLRAEFETTLPRFDVLATLHAAPAGLRMSELSRSLNVSNGNVTGVVDRLVTDGLLRRDAVDGDRRAFRVRLTEQGVEVTETMIAAHREWIDSLLSQVDGVQTDDAIAAMQAVRSGAARYR